MPEREGEATSKKQQRVMGAVTKCQMTGKCISPKVRRLSKKMDPEDVLAIARTKHDKLPDNYWEQIIREEVISYLQEVGAIPCGKCGKQCPCETPCEKPNPTGFIVNGSPIQIKNTAVNTSGDCDCDCECNVSSEKKTPLMPPNQRTQFGNTPEFNGDTTNNSDNVYNDKISKLLNFLNNTPKKPAVFNGKAINLYEPSISDDYITFFIEKEGIIKEYKVKKSK